MGANCERCRRTHPNEYGLWDFCARCSKDLCDACMEKGCCKNTPALSGMEGDNPEEDEIAMRPAPERRGEGWEKWAEKHAGIDDDHDHYSDDEPEREGR